jgi:ABC-type phosphate/phosphonate transport system substrate-binding protein
MNPVRKSDPDTAVSPDEVGYVFSTADNTTIQWVISGKTPVGVIDNVTFQRLPEETQAELRIFARTEDVPRQLVLVNANMPADLVEALEEVLLTANETEAGQAALETFLTTEFDRFPQGADRELSRMDELYQLVKNRE